MEATLALELRMERESNNGSEFVKCKFRAGFCEDNLARNLKNANFALEDEVAERMKRLPLRAGMSKRPVLVYDGHLDPVVEGSGFFAAVVSGRRLLGL